MSRAAALMLRAGSAVVSHRHTQGEVARLGVHRHAAVVAHMLVSSRGYVEERRFATVGVAHQRHGNHATSVGRHRLHAAFQLQPCLLAFAVIGLEGGQRRGGGQAFVVARFSFAYHLHEFGLLATQRNLIAHDFVFNGVVQRCVEHHLHGFAAHKAHFHNAFAKATVAVHLHNHAALTCM